MVKKVVFTGKATKKSNGAEKFKGYLVADLLSGKKIPGLSFDEKDALKREYIDGELRAEHGEVKKKAPPKSVKIDWSKIPVKDVSASIEAQIVKEGAYDVYVALDGKRDGYVTVVNDLYQAVVLTKGKVTISRAFPQTDRGFADAIKQIAAWV